MIERIDWEIFIYSFNSSQFYYINRNNNKQNKNHNLEFEKISQVKPLQLN